MNLSLFTCYTLLNTKITLVFTFLVHFVKKTHLFKPFSFPARGMNYFMKLDSYFKCKVFVCLITISP